MLAYEPSPTDTYSNVSENTGTAHYFNVEVSSSGGVETLSVSEVRAEPGYRRSFSKFVVEATCRLGSRT